MKPTKSTKEIGAVGERIAARYLLLHGYLIKERNWYAGHMEIDIIAESLHSVAFVEVKARTYTKETLATAPPPRSAVRAEKQRLTRKAASQYLHLHPTKKQPRMDVIEISFLKSEDGKKTKVVKIQHLKGAY
jgi:putative endonuclease